jgi:vitamin B12 transporter
VPGKGKITEELFKKSGRILVAILSTVAGLEINGKPEAVKKTLGYYIRGGSRK